MEILEQDIFGKGSVFDPHLLAESRESILIRTRDARQGRAANDCTLLAPKYPELAKDPWGALTEVLRDAFGGE